MKKIRIIPKLDVKGPNVVKGIQLEGLRVIGKPEELAKKYYEQGADEIIYIDIVASLYERNNLKDVVEKTASVGVFIPITVGGGIRQLEDIKIILRAGADKVAINTAAVRNPDFITQASKIFGSQCIIGAIEAKDQGNGKWEAYIDNGRERTGLDAIEWAKKLVELGVGEILITSVDRDGTKKGYDVDLIKRIVAAVSVPVVACGGASNEENIHNCLENTCCDGIAFGSILHYNKTTIGVVKDYLSKKNVSIRKIKKACFEKVTNSHKKAVSIIDFNAGNIKSVISAFKNMGNPVKLINSIEEINNAELLVLPGDGAFGHAIKVLNKNKLIEPIKKFAKSGKPLLGICLGMQLLMSKSEEFGVHKGLNIIPGKVVPFKSDNNINDIRYTIPHMGWNNLIKAKNAGWKETILSTIPENTEVYFVHSYYVLPDNQEHVLASTKYGNQNFCSVIKKDNVYGTQFHPEKSSNAGIAIIQYFSSL